MDGGAWWAAVHGIAKSRTRMSDFTFTFHFHALEKEMATHSSVLAWRIPGTGEPGGLPSMGSHKVGHDWSNLAAAVVPNNVPNNGTYIRYLAEVPNNGNTADTNIFTIENRAKGERYFYFLKSCSITYVVVFLNSYYIFALKIKLCSQWV